MAQFEPGVSGNPNGRPIGAEGKKAKLVKDVFQKIYDSEGDRLLDEIKLLKGREFVNAMIALAPYLAPKLQATSLDVDVMKTVEKLDDEQLEVVIQRIAQMGGIK